MTHDLKLILVDPIQGLCDAFTKHFKDLPNTQVVKGYFEKLPHYDCMVSAANSFGLMDGGVDAAITRYFGDDLMYRVQRHIIDHYLGEQPVGTSFIIGTGDDEHPFLAHTPTMRVPMEIIGTDNVYLAMWSMLLAVRAHNQVDARKITTIACPGLGTRTGNMPYGEAARQMALAYKNFLRPPTSIDWPFATLRQGHVVYGGYDGLVLAAQMQSKNT